MLPSTSYSTSEIDAIESYVRNGGGLFVCSEYGTIGNNLEPIIERFGFGRDPSAMLYDSDDNLGSNQLIKYDSVINHSITLGVNTIEQYAGSGFSIMPSSATPLIIADSDGTATFAGSTPADGVPIVASVVTSGNGRVVVCGDTSFLDDSTDSDTDGINNYFDDDNEVFCINTIRWLFAAGVQEKIVLFDESKVPTYSIEGQYELFGHYLTMNGYTIKWMDYFYSSLINEVDIIFIVNGLAPYSTAQKDIISDFINDKDV